ncbi:MAG: NADH-quinone oxidoreductase subunit C [Candidatus Fermentibacteraceae bacterium]
MDRRLQGLEEAFDGLDIEPSRDGGKRLLVDRGSVLSLLSALVDRGFDHLHMVSCVDWPEQKELELVYILSAYNLGGSFEEEHRDVVMVGCRVPRNRPVAVSAIRLFECAEPYEREIHELFGVRFEGHPRLTPLFLDRHYETPPFRKDFDTRQYVEDFFGRVPPVGDGDGERT